MRATRFYEAGCPGKDVAYAIWQGAKSVSLKENGKPVLWGARYPVTAGERETS